MPSEQSRQSASSINNAARAEQPSASPSAPPRPKVWESEELFGDAVEVFIAHEEQLYRLRRTRNGKLILCK